MDQGPILLTQVLFDTGRVSHGSIVKWTGLVRDIGQPQLMQKHENDQSFVETTPYRCELIPGRSQWIQEVTVKNDIEIIEKRITNNQETKRLTGQKKKRDEYEDGLEVVERTKKFNDETTNEKPIQFKRGPFQVIARGYGSIQFKVNHVYEFVGELDLTPQTSEDVDMHWQGDEECSTKEVAQAVENFPLLHVQDAHEIDYEGEVMRYFRNTGRIDAEQTTQASVKWCIEQWISLGFNISIDQMRNKFIQFLASKLLGDEVAAEYLLLCLLSRVYQRSEASTPFGHYSINLLVQEVGHHINDFVQHLHEGIQEIVPITRSLDLTIDSLCSATYFPHKDYAIDYLHTGELQLPDGAAFVVNETNMTVGQLNDRGTQNIQALINLVENQVLPYDFQYYQKEFHQDSKVISISKEKSILPTAASIRISPQQSYNSPNLEPGILDCFRLYLAVFRNLTTDLGNEGATYAEKWFVDIRKDDKSIGPDDLHRVVRTARLQALSYGQSVVTHAMWTRTLELEKSRSLRGKSN